MSSALYSNGAWACATCGQSWAFTPKILAISTAFFFLPVSIVCFVAWKVYKSHQPDQNSAMNQDVVAGPRSNSDGPKKES